MTSRTLTVEVELTARWYDVIVVTVPEDATEKDANTAVERALDSKQFEPDQTDVEIASWSFKDRPVFAPGAPLTFPRDENLIIHWNGYRWATTGVIAIREDAPCPSDPDDEWIVKSEQMQHLLSQVQLTLEPPMKMRFQTKFAPVLQSGKAVVARWENVVGCGILADDGQLKAIVMPFHGSGATVNCEGNP